MKRIVVIACVLLLAGLTLGFAGGKKEAGAGKLIDVAVSFPGSVEFFSVQKRGMDQAAADFGMRLIYADAEWDAGKQLSQVENFAARKPALILLCPADNEALMPAVKVSADAGVPLITFTNQLGTNEDGSYPGMISHIGINAVNEGRLLGEMAFKLVGDRPANIVLIEGTPGTSPQRMRTQGFKEVMAKYPGWKIVYSQAIPGWTKEGSLAAMEAFLQTGQRVDIVVCQWHAAATAAAQAIREKGYTQNKVAIVGLEFSRELVPAIKGGDVDMTSNYSIAEMGYKAVETAARYLKGEQVQKFIEIKPVIVSKDNVDSMVPEL